MSEVQNSIQNEFKEENSIQNKPLTNDFEFDCPEPIDFKDPNVDDLIENRKMIEIFDKENASDNTKIDSRTKLTRNQTHTKLYKFTMEKKDTLSPISKKKKSFKTILYTDRRVIKNVNERLYNAAQRRKPTYKTFAELVQDFDKNTRVYEGEHMNNLKKNLITPRSPKLLSKNRNRTRTALSQLEKDELIARTIQKNTFKAQPINKKIFNNYVSGIPKVKCEKKSTINNLNFGFHSTRRLEMRKEKTQIIQHDENVNFIFKARPMPVFKKVPIVLRNNQLVKKQTSETCLNKNHKTKSTIIKQISDSTLTRIAHADLIDDEICKDQSLEANDILNSDKNIHENSINELMSKSLVENLSTFKIEEEASICEIKSLE